MGIKNNKAHGSDDISSKMIKLCGNHLAKPLQIIFQNILDTGRFPELWKLANVIPVHKKKDKQIVENYRPISLLPLFSKMFEKLIFKHIFITIKYPMVLLQKINQDLGQMIL